MTLARQLIESESSRRAFNAISRGHTLLEAWLKDKFTKSGFEGMWDREFTIVPRIGLTGRFVLYTPPLSQLLKGSWRLYCVLTIPAAGVFGDTIAANRYTEHFSPTVANQVQFIALLDKTLRDIEWHALHAPENADYDWMDNVVYMALHAFNVTKYANWLASKPT
jgi:hypothetical protein